METVYKRGYCLTKLIDEMCLFEISEIIVVNDYSNIFIVSKQIQILDFHEHFEAFEIDEKKTVVNDCKINNINEFSDPPINIIKTATGKLIIRLKEFFS